MSEQPPATPRVLVTGATGFVGRQLVRRLRQRGASVRVVVRRGSEGRLDRVAGLDGVIATDDLFEEPRTFWRDACAGVDTVIHAAWYAEPGKYLESPLNLGCLEGTLRLARGSVDAGVRKFVGLGTCFEYDLAAGSPAGHFSVDTPLRPSTTYAACKVSAWLSLSRWLPAHSVGFLWCRLFYLHGEGEHPQRLVPYLRGRLAAGEPVDLTRGEQVRDFLDVSEAAEHIVTASLGGEVGAVNVCSGRGVTVRALAEAIADEYGRRDLLRFGARPENLVDPPIVVGVRGALPGARVR